MQKKLERFIHELRFETIMKKTALRRDIYPEQIGVRNSWHGLSLCLVLTLLLGGCSGEVEEAAPVVRPVKIVEFGVVSADQTREYPGSIAPTEEADLSFEVSGQIVAFLVLEGQAVRRGAVLARIDGADYRARRDAASANRLAAEATYERFQQLYEQNVVSLQDLEVRRRDFDVADANLKTAQKALDDTELRAPFSGIVARTYVDNFRNVQAKQSVLKLQNEDMLEIRVNVPEADALLGALAPRSPERVAELNPRVVVSALPGREFPARITEFSTSADPVTRTFEATLAFDPPDDARILPGMTARVIIDVFDQSGSKGQVTLPTSAVFADENGDPHVWIIDPALMSVKRIPIVVGDLSGAEIEIRSGLSSGALIAVSGVHHLQEGMRVRRLVN